MQDPTGRGPGGRVSARPVGLVGQIEYKTTESCTR